MDQIASAMRRGQSDQDRCMDEFLFHPLAMRKCDCFFVFVTARPVNNAAAGIAARCAAGLFLGMCNNKNAAYPALIGRWICRLYCFFSSMCSFSARLNRFIAAGCASAGVWQPHKAAAKADRQKSRPKDWRNRPRQIRTSQQNRRR